MIFISNFSTVKSLLTNSTQYTYSDAVMTGEDIAIQFIATLFGVLTGIPIAFWLDRRITASHERKRAIAVLTATREEITHNVELLRQMQGELRPNSMIYYNMDMNTWRATSLEDFEGIISHEILRQIFRTYYEYEHISRKIDAQFNMHYSVVRTTLTPDEYVTERKEIIGAILVHAERLEKSSGQLTNEIENELRRLGNS